MVSIMCIGGGGGGGGGFTATAGSARGGGGSGGSSGLSRVVVPAFLLPDRLYVQVGAGGQGVGSGGGTAGSGVLSHVSIYPSVTTIDINTLVRSGAAAATGGGTGTGAAAGAAGVAGTITVITTMPLAGLGHFDLIAGQVGFAGGVQTGAVGVASTHPNTSTLCQSGSGGAGTQSADFAGGAFTGVADTFLNEHRPATPAAGSNDGSGGVTLWKPFYMFGGGGGSSSNTGVGGAGGNGAYGCGGGGGGGGTTGGRGGDGGTGLVIIIAW